MMRTLIMLAAGLLLAGPAIAQSGGDYDLTWNTIDGGGDYTLTGGFWVIPECPAIPADYDGDCDVDQADYPVFDMCASGPGYVFATDCDDRDFDTDGDIDQADFAVFQRCYSGSDIPANSNCAD